MNAGKPRNRDGYTPEDLLQVRSTCLTVAATLGAQLDRLCMVGGLVPNLLIDEQYGPDPQTGDVHPGTSDLDVAMQIALLDNKAYAEITTRLRQEGFGPDTNEPTRKVPVCGPGAFVVLKALAFADRVEPKDAYDLVYVVRRWPGGTADITRRLSPDPPMGLVGSVRARKKNDLQCRAFCGCSRQPGPATGGHLRGAG